MHELLKHQVLMVGGKGGVGKTTIAAMLAVAAAGAGQRCLLVSTDPAHSLGDLFDRKIGDRRKELIPRLLVQEIDPQISANRYIEKVAAAMRDLVRPQWYRAIEQQMQLAKCAPGTTEAALLERLTELVIDSQRNFDLVVVDTAATGHSLRLLALPELMGTWIEGLIAHNKRSQRFGEIARRYSGRTGSQADNDSVRDLGSTAQTTTRNGRIRELLEQRRNNFQNAREILLDRSKSAFVVVLTAEKLPILETKNSLKLLQKQQIPVAALIVNRLLPKQLNDPFMHNRQRQEARYLAEIDREFGSMRRYLAPLKDQDVRGVEALQWLAEQVAEPSNIPPASV